jgi:hypothetical protein
MPEKEYVRLTRARPRAKFAVISSGNSSLWLGKDHLLCIDTTGYTENYKRFYFRDIQAFIVHKTDRYKWWSLILGVLAAGCLLSAAFSSGTVLKIILGIVGALFSLIFLVNVALGQSSACQVRTAVQIEELPSLNRLRQTRKAMARLRPLIVAAQGALTPGEISSLFRQSSSVESAAALGIVNPASTTVQEPPNAPAPNI